MAPVRVRVPVPVLVREPVPLTIPDMVRLLPFVSKVPPAALRVTVRLLVKLPVA